MSRGISAADLFAADGKGNVVNSSGENGELRRAVLPLGKHVARQDRPFRPSEDSETEDDDDAERNGGNGEDELVATLPVLAFLIP